MEMIGYYKTHINFSNAIEQNLKVRQSIRDDIPKVPIEIYAQEFSKAKIFNLNSDIIKLLEKTDNKIHYRKLPFKNIFLNYFIKVIKSNDEIIVNGVNIVDHNCNNTENQSPLLDVQFWIEYPNKVISFATMLIIDKENYEYKEISDNFIVHNNICSKQKIDNHVLKLKKEIAKIICNFLDLINSPDVELITIERTKEQNEKRIKKGKIPIPQINNIVLTGKLKIYLNELLSSGHIDYHHKFWVRGHFRTLRNKDRYKDKVGTKIWIYPYIKGNGILINKKYEVKECHIQ